MQRKLFLSYVLIILSLVVVTFWSILGTVRSMVSENITSTSEQAMARWASELDYVMRFGKSYLLNIAINEDVQEILRTAADSGRGRDSRDERLLDEFMEQNSQLLYANSVVLGNIPFMMEICYRDDEGAFVPVYYSSRLNVSAAPTYAPDHALIQQLLAQDGKFLWSTSADDSNNYIRLSKVVYDTQDYSRIIGFVAVEFLYRDIALSVLNRLRSDSDIEAYIVDRRDGVVVGYTDIGLEKHLPLELKGSGSYMSDDGKSYIMERSLGDSDYYIVGIKSMDQVQDLYINACRILFISAAAAAILATVLASLFSRSISGPIKTLSTTMKNVENGDLDITVTNRYKGEIGELYSSFNYMFTMINSLIEDNYVSQLNQKQSELNALQAQINTHFLYNTLDTINWLAKGYQAEDISKLVTSLSTLLRLSLNNGNMELTVERELEHVRCYIDIQNIRFDGLFRVWWDIDEGVKKDRIIKMLLQPLVENAIHHGFDNPSRDKADNRLIISVKLEESFLVLRVSNNGDEIDLKKVQELLASGPSVEQQSYGVLSIKSRLAMYYGGQADYTYHMDGEKMIVATIRIPREYTEQGRE